MGGSYSKRLGAPGGESYSGAVVEAEEDEVNPKRYKGVLRDKYADIHPDKMVDIRYFNKNDRETFLSILAFYLWLQQPIKNMEVKLAIYSKKSINDIYKDFGESIKYQKNCPKPSWWRRAKCKEHPMDKICKNIICLLEFGESDRYMYMVFEGSKQIKDPDDEIKNQILDRIKTVFTQESIHFEEEILKKILRNHIDDLDIKDEYENTIQKLMNQYYEIYFQEKSKKIEEIEIEESRISALRRETIRPIKKPDTQKEFYKKNIDRIISRAQDELIKKYKVVILENYMDEYNAKINEYIENIDYGFFAENKNKFEVRKVGNNNKLDVFDPNLCLPKKKKGLIRCIDYSKPPTIAFVKKSNKIANKINLEVIPFLKEKINLDLNDRNNVIALIDYLEKAVLVSYQTTSDDLFRENVLFPLKKLLIPIKKLLDEGKQWKNKSELLNFLEINIIEYYGDRADSIDLMESIIPSLENLITEYSVSKEINFLNFNTDNVVIDIMKNTPNIILFLNDYFEYTNDDLKNINTALDYSDAVIPVIILPQIITEINEEDIAFIASPGEIRLYEYANNITRPNFERLMEIINSLVGQFV